MWYWQATAQEKLKIGWCYIKYILMEQLWSILSLAIVSCIVTLILTLILIQKHKQQMKPMTISYLDAAILSSRPSKPFYMSIQFFFWLAALADMFIRKPKHHFQSFSSEGDYEWYIQFCNQIICLWFCTLKKHFIFKKKQISSNLLSEHLCPRLMSINEMSEEQNRPTGNMRFPEKNKKAKIFI